MTPDRTGWIYATHTRIERSCTVAGVAWQYSRQKGWHRP